MVGSATVKTSKEHGAKAEAGEEISTVTKYSATKPHKEEQNGVGGDPEALEVGSSPQGESA
jgi:hypothetical protein